MHVVGLHLLIEEVDEEQNADVCKKVNVSDQEARTDDTDDNEDDFTGILLTILSILV